jgi:hypothetical protein
LTLGTRFAIAALLIAGIAGEEIARTDGPALSDVEQLRKENVALKSQLHAALTERDGFRVQLAPLRLKYDGDAVRADLAKLKADIEAAHDGFTFNLQTGALEPKPPAPEKK